MYLDSIKMIKPGPIVSMVLVIRCRSVVPRATTQREAIYAEQERVLADIQEQ